MFGRSHHALRSLGLSARKVLVGAVVLALLAACGGAEDGGNGGVGGSGGDEEMVGVTILLDYLMDGNKAPIALGKEKGFFSDRGIDLTIEEGSGSSDVVKFVGNGRFDFGFAGAPEVADGVEAGIPVVMVGNHQPQGQHVIFVRGDSGIETIEDLENRSVVTGSTSESEPLLEPVLEAAGVDVNQVEIARVDINVADQSFLRGQYDGLANPYEAIIGMNEAEPDAEFRAFWYADYGLSTMNQGLITHTDTLEEDPDLVSRMVEAYAESYIYASQNKEELIEVVSKAYPAVNPEGLSQEYDIAMSLVGTENTADEPFGFMAPEDWDATVEALVTAGRLEEGTDPEDFHTNEFIGDWESVKPIERS